VRRAGRASRDVDNPFARTLCDGLRARGALAAVHLHDHFSGSEPFRLLADVGIKRYEIGRFVDGFS
jgi:hypothetical protein